MMKPDLTKSEMANAALQLFPLSIRRSLLEDSQFRLEFGVNTRATISLGQPKADFERTKLFASIRALYGGEQPDPVCSDDGMAWALRFKENANRQFVVLSCENRQFELAEFWPLSPDSLERSNTFEKFADTLNFRGAQFVEWRQILADRPVTDEEFDELQSALRATPQMNSAAMGREIRSGTSDVSTLVPRDTHYYERLVGDGKSAFNLVDYVERIARSHILQLLSWRELDGLRFALLVCAHPYFSKLIDSEKVSPKSLSRVLEWLERNGDRHSQLGAVEFGLNNLERYPDIEPSLLKLVEQFRIDDPQSENGRLKLLSSLIALVEGEFARTQIFRGLPPFWRRLASIAQGSLIECHLAQVSLEIEEFSDFALKRAGRNFYMQTLVDLRLEPRWFPDAINASQLKAEFLGRIASTAKANEHKIRSRELRDLVLGDGADGIQVLLNFPYYCIPGPLEGAFDSQIDIPQSLKESVEADLSADVLKVNSFAGLVNSVLVFRIGPELVSLSSKALQRVKYQLQQDGSQDQSFALLAGLSTVAGITRSAELADQVRILTRVLRKRSDVNMGAQDALRICMVAAACHRELGAWCKFVGDWLTEIAFDSLEQDSARTLMSDIEMLCQIQPSLWRTCGKAHAACKAVVQQ
jgi:hypothetical protein